MNKILRWLLFSAVLIAAGCAARHPAPGGQPSGVALSATQPIDPKANLSLDDIEPKLTLPAPATPPWDRASLEAIQVYAQARAALIDNKRFSAITLLEKAAKLDPYGFQIFYDLGRVLLSASATGLANDRALVALEKAATLDPDSLDLQYELGHQYLDRNDNVRALQHLRLAHLTTGYGDGKHPDTCALVDFFLGRALRQAGYLTAAQEQYTSLLTRMSRSRFSSRSSAELIEFVKHPQLIYTEIGELYEQKRNYSEALHAYELALQGDRDNTDLSKRVVRMSLSAGHPDDAKARALALVVANHGSAESLDLLRDIYRSAGDPRGLSDALARLHREHPTDRSIFYALLDQMKVDGHSADAENLLAHAVRDSHSDPDYIRRLFTVYQGRNDMESAMRLLVDSLADRPDSLRDIGPLWSELLRPSRHGRLRLSTLLHMKVPEREDPARLFWVSRLAEIWNRDALARGTLQQAAAIKPAFAPVYRWLIAENWARPDWDDQQKIAACRQLVDTVELQGDKSLAAELRGRSLLLQDDAAGAAKAFSAAQALGSHSPDLQLMHARAIFKQGNETRAEQLLWALLSDWPQYEEAYSELFSLYLQRRAVDQSIGVLRKWLAAVPTSVDARLLEVAVDAQIGQPDAIAAAKAVLQVLFDEQPENLQVLRAMENFYLHHAKIDDFIVKLEAERTKNPDNREAVEVLVSIYADQKRVPEATRVLAAARNAVAKDPDLLYYVAHLYERIEQKQVTEQLLQEIVAMDPHHAAASNDLGYTWADEGRNLSRAEALVRVAVEAEPDNQSYLDSMAWVEYKRGKFTEARIFLDRAIGPANRPDPVVLDHLGDTMYRLHQPWEAARQWKRSLERLAESSSERDDLKELRQQLLAKLKQQEQGQPVHVAPVAEGPAKTT